MKWVLIDLSFLAYRAMHTVGDLSHEDIPTGVIFGFFHQLKQVCTDPKVMSNRIAIFRDSKKSYRKVSHPFYKAKRQDRTPEEIQTIHLMHKQVNKLTKEWLPAIGIPVYSQFGLESDDLIASVARKLSDPKSPKHGVIISADGDLWQCISSVVHWYDPQRGVYYTPESFMEKKGIHPKRWGEVKSLAGCHSDNVPGVPGVGEKTAVDYLNTSLPVTYKRAREITTNQGKAIRSRNRQLVILPHDKTKEVTLIEPTYKPEVFFDLCTQYGMSSFLKEENAWRVFFRGSHFTARKRGQKRV